MVQTTDQRNAPRPVEEDNREPGRAARAAESRKVVEMHGWMEFWAKEHVEDLMREARRARFARGLRAARIEERRSRSRGLIRGLERLATGIRWARVRCPDGQWEDQRDRRWSGT